METKKLGSLYFDDVAVKPGQVCETQQFAIGDTVPGKELGWIQDGSILVADRTICLGVTWDDLNERGLVFGVPVSIDGKRYLCRCLKVGSKVDAPNEWNDLLRKFGHSNAIWHWKGQYFWGQEVPEGHHGLRVGRGGNDPFGWTFGGEAAESGNCGWRPVLEPLEPLDEIEPSNDLLGSRFKVYGPQGEPVTGELSGFDDYDLVLSAADVPVDCEWTGSVREHTVISREDISLMQKI